MTIREEFLGKQPSTLSVAGRQPFRDEAVDSIKGLLIVLVIFGHLIEKTPGPIAKAIYAVIYSFHMPLFVLLAGMYWRPDLHLINKRNVRLLLIYCVGEAIYVPLEYLSSGNLQSFFTPYWIMWFLFSLMFWNLLMLAFRNNVLMLIPAVIISIGSGACSWLGYPFSAQRTLYFLPFFVLGHHLSVYRDRLAPVITPSRLVAGLAMLGLILVFVFSESMHFHRGILRGSNSYQSLGLSLVQGVGARATLLSLSSITITLILVLWMQLKITVLSTLGAKTLNIYILHGFIVLAIRKYLQISEPQSLLLFAALSLGIAFALSKVRLFK